MPKGFYKRTPERLATLRAHVSAILLSPQARAKSIATHRVSRPKRQGSYAKVGWNGKSTKLHRVLAEIALGKPLPNGAEVHHADGSRSIASYLVICQSKAYHKLLHARMRILNAGGNPNTDKICGMCKQVKPRTAFTANRSEQDGLYSRCQSCKREARANERSRNA